MSPPRELATKEPISPLGLVAPPPIHVQTPTFDGSLATLFKCVRDHKVELLDVPLFPICEAYFLYLLDTNVGNLDEAAVALTALSYLLERKAWLLLPSPEPEPEAEDPLELTSPTAHEYAVAIEALRRWHEERAKTFFHSPEAGPDPYELPFTLGDVSADDLARSFERALKRANPDPIEPINNPRRSLSEQMALVLKTMTKQWTSLMEIIPASATRSEVVYWFLAILELVRLGQIRLKPYLDEVKFALSE